MKYPWPRKTLSFLLAFWFRHWKFIVVILVMLLGIAVTLFIHYDKNNFIQEKTMEKKIPKQKIEEINVTQEGNNLQDVIGVEIFNNPNDLELGKVNIQQEGKNLKNVTGMKMQFDQNSGEVELKDKMQIIQKRPHGQSSVTFNADQPGIKVIFNKKSKENE